MRGEFLLRDVLRDAARALSALRSLPEVDASATGVLGHSMGCVVSFRHRIEHRTGFGMIELVPGIAKMIETVDLVRAIAPRPLLVVSASRDKYSADSGEIVAAARPSWGSRSDALVHLAVEGEHALDEARFDAIVEWVQRVAPTGDAARIRS